MGHLAGVSSVLLWVVCCIIIILFCEHASGTLLVICICLQVCTDVVPFSVKNSRCLFVSLLKAGLYCLGDPKGGTSVDL